MWTKGQGPLDVRKAPVFTKAGTGRATDHYAVYRMPLQEGGLT